MNKRAYATLELKAFRDGADGRSFEGIASTPTPDRMGDVVEPRGAKFKLPIPLLYQHDAQRPIGQITEATVTPSGIRVKAVVNQLSDPPSLKERLDVAWAEIKAGLVRGLSIGFNPLEAEPINPKEPWGALRFKAWEWLELSAVTIPANQDASITAIKSIDERLREAAPGQRAKAHPPPGASGTQTNRPQAGFFSPQGKGMNMQSIQQQLAALKEARQTKAARLTELDEARAARGGSFTEDERAEVKGITTEVQDLDDQIAVKQVLANESISAKPVESTIVARGMGGAPSFGFVRKADPDDKFQGQSEVRRIIARALAFNSLKSGEFRSAGEIAEQRWGKTHPMLVQVIKSGVAGATEASGGTWAELVQADGRFTGDFVEFLYSMTVFDRLALREVPANVIVKGQDGAATGYWVGEGKGIPVSAGSGSAVTLTPLKVGAISVASNEILADSSPAAEMLIRDSLVEASAQKVDTTFFSTTAASAGVSPAGILNGLSAGDSAGNTPAHVVADIQALLANFISGKYQSELTLVTTPTLAAAVGLMMNSLGLPAFANSNLTQKGGNFQGYPVLTGHNVPSGDVIMLSARDIWKIGDSGVQVSVSQEAMIEQDTAPSGDTGTPAAASANFTSMFQEESTAFKVVRRINWAKRRSDAVAYIGGASYNLGS